MTQKLTHRKAQIIDLRTIVNLLLEDEFGQIREKLETNLDQHYIDAFNRIESDPNQYLMLVEIDNKPIEIIATCHLTIMPSLTFKGSTRMQIEAVRVLKKYRGQKIGKWMMNAAILYGKSKGVSIFQLTTNKNRLGAKQFYEQIGFEATHIGMKKYV
jgi:GNAT superfamily N-acetyltransferase